MVKFRFPPESGYSFGPNFIEFWFRFRPGAAISKIRIPSPQGACLNKPVTQTIGCNHHSGMVFFTLREGMGLR
jgi:hypothetical protein